mgnify:CR=1 FL=1
MQIVGQTKSGKTPTYGIDRPWPKSMKMLTFGTLSGSSRRNAGAVASHRKKKRCFTQKFAYVYEKYASLKIRIRGARPKVYAVYRMRRVFAQNIRKHCLTRRVGAGPRRI